VTPSLATDQLLAMEAVVRSFPLGSAAGPSGLRPQHLLDCLNSADSAAKTGLLEALLTLVTTVIAGRLQPRAAPYLCAARLIQLKMKDGGVLPIAMGDTLRRLTAKWLLATSPGRRPTAALAPCRLPLRSKSLRGGGEGRADTGRHHAREHRVAVSAGVFEERLQLHSPAGHLERLGAAVLVNFAMGTTGLPTRAPARELRGHMVDPGGCSRVTPWALSSSPRASRQSWNPCHQVGPSKGVTWMMGFSWALWQGWKEC